METLSEVPAEFRKSQAAGAETSAAVERLLAAMGERVKTDIGVEAVFGPAQTIGERTIIPVARVAYGYGVGGGGGPTPAPDVPAVATGAGGGAAASAKPVAVVEITARGVRVIPIVDMAALMTRALVFAGVVAVAGILFGRPRTWREPPPKRSRLARWRSGRGRRRGWPVIPALTHK